MSSGICKSYVAKDRCEDPQQIDHICCVEHKKDQSVYGDLNLTQI